MSNFRDNRIRADLLQSRVGREGNVTPTCPLLLRGQLKCLHLFLLAPAATLLLQTARTACLL